MNVQNFRNIYHIPYEIPGKVYRKIAAMFPALAMAFHIALRGHSILERWKTRPI